MPRSSYTTEPRDASLAHLHETLSRPDDRNRISELLGLAILLDGCIVGKGFTISDDWIKPIALTPLGEELSEAVTSKHRKIRRNDARLATFLTGTCDAGILVDWGRCDLDGLRTVLNGEVHSGRILYPYIFGRNLHDAWNNQFPETVELNNAKTRKLLRGLPKGIFQVASTTVGPFGALASRQSRYMPPTRSAPGYLSQDHTDHAIHSIRLNTSDTRVSRARRYIYQLVYDEFGPGDDPYVTPVSRALFHSSGRHSTWHGPNLFDVLADDFTIDEVRSLAALLVRRGLQNHHLNRLISEMVAGTGPDSFVTGLERAELIHLLLLFRDDEIALAIDDCLISESLKVERDEQRQSKLNRWPTSTYRLRAVIGSSGLKYEGPRTSSLTAKRLQELLEHAYPTSVDNSRDELTFTMGIAQQTDPIAHAVRTMQPDEIITDLLTASLVPSKFTAEYLGLSSELLGDRTELQRKIAWRVGVPSRPEPSELDNSRSRLGELDRVAEASRSDIQSVAGPLFTGIETVLKKALIYSAWALTNDHYLDAEPFVYDPQMDFEALGYLNEIAPPPHDGLSLSHKTSTLVPLSSGFSRLAKALEHSDPQLRPTQQLPAQSQYGDSAFAFSHCVPFHDLTPASRSRLVDALKRVGKLFQNQDVLDVRNNLSHGNNPTPSAEQIRRGCRMLHDGCSLLIDEGLYPHQWILTSETSDEIGRRSISYSRLDEELTVTLPTRASTPRMPASPDRVIIMQGASIEGAGSLRFRRRGRHASGIDWSGWPVRLSGRSSMVTGVAHSDVEAIPLQSPDSWPSVSDATDR